MEIADFFELTLSDGSVVKLPVIKMTEIVVTEGADGKFRDKDGNIVEID